MGPAQYAKPDTEETYVYPKLAGHKIQAPEYGCMVGFHSSDHLNHSRGGYTWLKSQIGMGPRIMIPPYYRMQDLYTRFAMTRKLNVPEELIPHDVAYPFFYRDLKSELQFTKLSELENDGSFRKNIEAYAKNITKIKRPIFFTTMEEMNGGWYPWGQNAKGFKKTWRFMHTIFEDSGANEYTTWVWEPFTIPHSKTAVMHPDLFYPGDDFVDWIGLSVYRKKIYAEYDKSFAWLGGGTLKNLNRSHPEKPFIISEMGSDPDNRQPGWFTEAFNYIRRRPQIKAAVIWDNNNIPAGFNHTVTDDSFAALKKVFSDPYFIGIREDE